MTTDKTPATLATAKHGGCAQLPSPSDQGDARDVAAEAAWKTLQESGYLFSGEPFDDAHEDDQAVMRRVVAAVLAARQPVGEPAAWLVHWSDMPLESPEVTRSASRISEVTALTDPPRIVPLYASQPAQAVTGDRGVSNG